MMITLLAGDQWWPHTSGGRLRFAQAVMHLLRHRFGCFVKKEQTKVTATGKSDPIFCLGGQKLAILPIYLHANIIVHPGDDNLLNTLI